MSVEDVRRERDAFKAELMSLVNKYSVENYSDTPDLIVANYLLDCLCAWELATNQRRLWFGETKKGSANK